MIMVIGVYISHTSTAYFMLKVCYDVLGYGLHGMGLLPFVESIAKYHQSMQESKKEKDDNN